jgi:hypothetical protein
MVGGVGAGLGGCPPTACIWVCQFAIAVGPAATIEAGGCCGPLNPAYVRGVVEMSYSWSISAIFTTQSGWFCIVFTGRPDPGFRSPSRCDAPDMGTAQTPLNRV